MQDAPLPPGRHARLTLLPIGWGHRAWWGRARPVWSLGEPLLGGGRTTQQAGLGGSIVFAGAHGALPTGLGGGGPRGSEAWPSSRGPPTGWSAIIPARRCLCSGAGGLSPSHSPGAPRSGGPGLEVLPRRPRLLLAARKQLCFNFGSHARCQQLTAREPVASEARLRCSQTASSGFSVSPALWGQQSTVDARPQLEHCRGRRGIPPPAAAPGSWASR